MRFISVKLTIKKIAHNMKISSSKIISNKCLEYLKEFIALLENMSLFEASWDICPILGHNVKSNLRF